MLQTLSAEFEQRLRAWILSSLESGQNVLSGGYQGTVLEYQEGDVRLVVKLPPRSPWQRPLLIRTLRHEYRVYQKLGGMAGVPRCYGLLDGCFLVLEYIDGHSLRDGAIADRARFFEDLRRLLEELHARGVAHADLKKKDNILVAADNRPYLVDFGVACLRKSGYAPVNHWLFDLAVRFDFNAWIKHKYQRHYEEVDAADRAYLQTTAVERISRMIKQPYRSVRRTIRHKFLQRLK
jgi:predicted Ser/Thr protein kinase